MDECEAYIHPRVQVILTCEGNGEYTASIKSYLSVVENLGCRMAASRAGAVLGLIALIAMLMGQSSEALVFAFSNHAQGTTGGNRFDQEIGQNRKNIERVTLIVESINNPGIAAYTRENEIHLTAHYVGKFQRDAKAQIRGVLYHGMTHVWQWNGQGKAPGGLIEGIADYMRLSAGSC
ncbi:uncharacterized protein LOC131875770 [Cryptomeria japonica]|uniref:uncharacterized protein LOC131875770 n=1 Tax=Cryptomeria japonica TaxID=3369 RepID=UPI0027DA9A48|nr:uncharacterized protein LOC131875770 [Cryptomeria japonica]